MKALLTGIILLGSISTQVFAQECRSIRECQIKNQQLQNQLRVLSAENANLAQALRLCQQPAPQINSAQLDLLLSLQNKKFIGHNMSQICGSSQCGTTELRFIFVNDTLKAQMETESSNWSLSKETVNVVVPDKYGEFVTLPHPKDVRKSVKTSCRYIVEKNAQGEVTSLELLDSVERGTENCPEKYIAK